MLLGGKYQLEAELGAGGFGRVFYARHLQLGSPVAIKVGHSSTKQDALLREARAAAALTSPHSVRIYDVDEALGTPYIVMEYLEGCTLRTYLRQQKRVSPRLAVTWCLQVCVALEEAHDRGLAHCDIKPANLFLVPTRGGEYFVKLLDFGLSKTLRVDDTSELERVPAAGTPAYIPPERLLFGQADVSGDVWSLGVVLFEMLTGERPFLGPTTQDLLLTIASEPPRSLRDLAPELSATLNGIVQRCLRKNVSERYESVSALASALRTALSEQNNPSADEPTCEEATLSASRLTPQPTAQGTVQPTTLQPTTLQPTTLQPTTLQPTTLQPTTLQPTTLQRDHPSRDFPRRGGLLVVMVLGIVSIGFIRNGASNATSDPGSNGVSNATTAPSGSRLSALHSVDRLVMPELAPSQIVSPASAPSFMKAPSPSVTPPRVKAKPNVQQTTQRNAPAPPTQSSKLNADGNPSGRAPADFILEPDF
jgi:serine/threonine protein kinase